jgi:hypothetical protein
VRAFTKLAIKPARAGQPLVFPHDLANLPDGSFQKPKFEYPHLLDSTQKVCMIDEKLKWPMFEVESM